MLDRDLVGTLDLVERSPEGGLVVVDLKTAARKYPDLQVEASLQLSIYSYATAMNGLADEEELRLRSDVLTKTRQPELHRYWTTRDRAAKLRLYRLAAEILTAGRGGRLPAARRLALHGLPGAQSAPLGVGQPEARPRVRGYASPESPLSLRRRRPVGRDRARSRKVPSR